MKRQPEIILQSDRNTFSDSPQLMDNTAIHAAKRGLRGSQEKRAVQSYPLKWLANYAWLERADVTDNIGEFWHGISACAAEAQLRNGWKVDSYTGISIRLGP
jgi:hypothetical protein